MHWVPDYTPVDEARCRLLIMLGDGLRCTVLGDEIFSQRIDPMLLQEIFQTPFSNNNNKKTRKEKPTGRWHARNTHVTQTQIDSSSSRIFKRMVPVDYSYQSKQKYQEPFLFLSNNSLASFLSQMSNFLHSSLHPSTWSPKFTTRKYSCY